MNFSLNIKKLGNLITSLFVLTCATTIERAIAENLHFGALDLPPYGYIEQGKVTGAFIDLFSAIADESRVTASYQLYPIGRLFSQITSGKTDCTMLMEKTGTSAGMRQVSSMPWLISGVVIARASANVNRLEDLRGLRLGTLTTGLVGTPLERLGTNDTNKLYRHVSSTQNIRMLVNGRLDAVVGTGPNLHYLLSRYGPQFKHDEVVVFNSQLQLFCRNGITPLLLQRIKKSSEKLTKDGVLHGIIRNYK